MTGYFKLDSGGAANALAGTAESIRTDDGSLVVAAEIIRTDDGSSVVAAEIIRTDDGSSVAYAFKNASNMAELGAIKEGSGRNTRTDDGSCSNMAELQAIREGYFKLDSGGAANANHLAGTAEFFKTDDGSSAAYARYAFENVSNMAELRTIKEGTGAIMRTDDGSLVEASYAKHAFKKGSNMVELRGIKEGSYSGCIVEELPTMRLDVVSGENEKRSGKITLDLSQKAEKGITSGKIKRQENMATSIQKRLEIPEIKRVQGSMESLPSDVVLELLSRVPAESVLECKLVCKKWGIVISGTNFANMHLSHQLNLLHGAGDDDGKDDLGANVEPCLFFACRIDDPDDFVYLPFHGGQVSDRISNDEKYIYNQNLKRIYHPPMHTKYLYHHLVGSCNGLVCTLQDHHLVLDPIYICNPLTREYVYLPELVRSEEDDDPDRMEGVENSMYGRTSCGFGYVRSSKEYKVVRISYPKVGCLEGNVEVYTLGSGCGWRAIGTVPYRLESLGTCVNDAIYWTSYTKIVAFDLAKEEFRLLSVPPCLQDRRYGDRCGLVVLGRHLCFFMDKLRMEIWSLMKSSASKETWRLEFDIDYLAVVGSRKNYFRPILLTKKGQIIFVYEKSVLYCYDTKTTLLKMISNEAATDCFQTVDAIAHVNTFASLEATGEPSKRYTVRPSQDQTPCDDVIDGLDRVALGEEIDTTPFRFGCSAQ